MKLQSDMLTVEPWEFSLLIMAEGVSKCIYYFTPQQYAARTTGEWHVQLVKFGFMAYQPFLVFQCQILFMHIQRGEINIHTYENFHFSYFKHNLNKDFIYIYSVKVYSANMFIYT